MADIFLSYKSEDRPRILPLARALEARGYTVWWDLELIAGQRWAHKIQDELEDALCVVVIWTRLSVDERRRYASDWVEIEANHGRGRGVLVPALFDQGRVAFVHQTVQYADLVGWNGRTDHPGFAELVKGVALHAGARVRPEDVELAAWREAERTKTAAAYRAFLAANPSSRFAGIAKARVAELEELAAWISLGDAPGIAALTAFLGRFPRGRFAEAAEQRIATIGAAPIRVSPAGAGARGWKANPPPGIRRPSPSPAAPQRRWALTWGVASALTALAVAVVLAGGLLRPHGASERATAASAQAPRVVASATPPNAGPLPAAAPAPDAPIDSSVDSAALAAARALEGSWASDRSECKGPAKVTIALKGDRLILAIPSGSLEATIRPSRAPAVIQAQAADGGEWSYDLAGVGAQRLSVNGPRGPFMKLVRCAG